MNHLVPGGMTSWPSIGVHPSWVYGKECPLLADVPRLSTGVFDALNDIEAVR